MLSPNFSLQEMIISGTAARRGIDNTPDELEIQNLKLLCEYVLEPVRLLLPENDVLMVTSGFRSIYLNQAIGGSKNSQHCRGQAADTYSRKLTVDALYKLIRESSINLDQCIWEFGKWIHLSFNVAGNRNEYLRALKNTDGDTYYVHD